MKCKRCKSHLIKAVQLEGHRYYACAGDDGNCGKPKQKITPRKHYSLTAVKAEAEEYFKLGHNVSNILRHYEKRLYHKDFVLISQHMDAYIKHFSKLGMEKILQEVIESKHS